MTTLEWVTNEPADPEEGARATDMSRGKYLAWRKKFIEMEPHATAAYTSEQLREMGMVGLYRERRDG